MCIQLTQPIVTSYIIGIRSPDPRNHSAQDISDHPPLSLIAHPDRVNMKLYILSCVLYILEDRFYRGSTVYIVSGERTKYKTQTFHFPFVLTVHQGH